MKSEARLKPGHMKVDGDILFVPDDHLGSTLADNATTTILRAESGETVFTNLRGWRVPAPRPETFAADLMFAGPSLVMGEGSEYEDTFAGQIETRLGVRIANVGVSSHSLLQVTRRLEQEIAFARAIGFSA